MEKITFTCETLVPMFLNGADGQTPELRGASIKGMLRFWWRALNGHLELKELKKRETLIFGGTSPAVKSKVKIRINKFLTKTKNTAMLPHREKTWTNLAFSEGEEFVVTLLMPHRITNGKGEVFSSEKLKALFLLVSILGGLGKRVRRGFGSFKVNKVELNNKEIKEEIVIQVPTISQIFDLVKLISPSSFTLKGKKIVFTYSGKTVAYPFIKEIEIGKEKASLLKLIGETTHALKQDHNAYEASLGHANDGRFASPIFVSHLDMNTPIITTLNTVPEKNRHHINRLIQEDFKRAILK